MKVLEAVSQLCNTIKVQSTGPQVEVFVNSDQGHTHIHTPLCVLIFLEASGMKKGWGAIINLLSYFMGCGLC